MKRPEISDAEDHVSLAALDSSALRLIDPVAVLIVVRGMILAHSFPTATTTRQVTINQDMKALRCRDSIDPYFLRNLFVGVESHLVSLVDSAAHGTRKLETEVLGRFEVCVPPPKEQRPREPSTQSDFATLGLMIRRLPRTRPASGRKPATF
jgi:type I restriction enzyme, S subunit